VVQVAACDYHTAVVTSDGEVFTFGQGKFGQLGHGNTNKVLVPRRVGALEEKCVVQAAVGIRHTVVLCITTI